MPLSCSWSVLPAAGVPSRVVRLDRPMISLYRGRGRRNRVQETYLLTDLISIRFKGIRIPSDPIIDPETKTITII